MRAWAERGRARQAPRDAEFPLCMWVCLLCQSGFKEKFVCIVCCAVQLRTLCFVLTYHPSVLHKCYLIKRACVCAHGKAILPVNLHTGRNRSYLSAARCFPPRFLWMERVFCFSLQSSWWEQWAKIALPRRHRAREKALARNNWICFIGKVLVCVYVHVSNNQTPSDTEAERVSGRDGGLCF